MVVDVHTPSSSFAIIYTGKCFWPREVNVCLKLCADADDNLQTIYTKLTQKAFTELNGKPVRAGYVKYEWNNSFYNLDDGMTSLIDHSSTRVSANC